MVVGRFVGEFSRDFVKARDYIARQKACAQNGHFNSSANMAMSMFKLSTTPRWALMAVCFIPAAAAAQTRAARAHLAMYHVITAAK